MKRFLLIGAVLLGSMAYGADTINDFIIPARGNGGNVILEPKDSGGTKRRILTADPANQYLLTPSGVKVGIGTDTPGASLAIKQASDAITGALLLTQSGGATQNGGMYIDSSGYLNLRQSGTNAIKINNGRTYLNQPNTSICTYGSGNFCGGLNVRNESTSNIGIAIQNQGIGGTNSVGISFINEFTADQYNHMAYIQAVPEQSWTSTNTTRDATLYLGVSADGSLTYPLILTSGGHLLLKSRREYQKSTPGLSTTGYQVADLNGTTNGDTHWGEFNCAAGNPGSDNIRASVSCSNNSGALSCSKNVSGNTAQLDITVSIAGANATFTFKSLLSTYGAYSFCIVRTMQVGNGTWGSSY